MAIEDALDLADEIVDYRAELIAENESALGAAEGERIALGRMVEDGLLPAEAERMWVAQDDNRVCDDCAALDETTTPVDGLFADDDGEYNGPPRHLHCRCYTVMVNADVADKEAAASLINWERLGQRPDSSAGGRFTGSDDSNDESTRDSGRFKAMKDGTAEQRSSEWEKLPLGNNPDDAQRYADSAGSFNQPLRKEKEAFGPGSDAYGIVKVLDEYIESAPPLDRDLVVHRVVGADMNDVLKPGAEFADHGFTSTSVYPINNYEGPRNPVMMKILLPAGTHAARPAYGHEYELIIARGSRFRVLSRTKDEAVVLYLGRLDGAK